MSSSKKLWHEITTKTFTTKYYYLDQGIYYFIRDQFVISPYIEIDAFSDFWCIGLGDIKKNQIGFGRNNSIIEFHGKVGFIATPKSIIEWHVNKGPFRWHGFISSTPLPKIFPQGPTIFTYDQPVPSSSNELNCFMKSIKNLSRADKVEEESAVAFRTKGEIDTSYMTNISIKDISNKLKYSHPVMTRMFKKCYGLTPIEYRNKLRIFEAQKLFLTESYNVSQICKKTGFNDSSRFYRQFKKNTTVSPLIYVNKN